MERVSRRGAPGSQPAAAARTPDRRWQATGADAARAQIVFAQTAMYPTIYDISEPLTVPQYGGYGDDGPDGEPPAGRDPQPRGMTYRRYRSACRLMLRNTLDDLPRAAKAR